MVAKFVCPIHPYEYRVVKKFPLEEWEMGRDTAVKMTDDQLTKAKINIKNFKKMTKVLHNLS